MITVETASTRTIDGFDTNYFVMNRLSYYPFWNGVGSPPTNTGYVSISGGFTSMTFQLFGANDDYLVVTKYLNISGRQVIESEVQNELIAAGWITMADTVTIS